MRKSAFSLLAALVLMSDSGWSQITTGRLIGTTLDRDGAVLTGVTVTIESPALIGGPQSKATDSRGEFSFLGLSPGYYNVTAELVGYIPQERARVKVSVGGAAALTIAMPAGSFSGEIEVVDETPVVDPTQVDAGQVFDTAYMQGSAVGSANRAYGSIVEHTPGVELGLYAGWPFLRVYGSTEAENAFYIDGIDTTAVIFGIVGFSSLNFDALQEVGIQTGGFEAQYGRATGGIINVVTKSGGNRFSGAVDARFRTNSFQESGEFFDASELDSRYRNFAATLGGPLRRDSLWFFASWQGFSDDDTPIASPTTRSTDGENFIAKLTWAINPSWRFSGKYTGEFNGNDNANASQFVSAEATSYSGVDAQTLSGELSGVLSDSLLFNLAAGRTAWAVTGHPMSGDRETIAHYNYDTNMDTENFSYQWHSDERRDDLAVDLTWFVEDFGGSHEFKGGVQFSRPVSEGWECYTGSSSPELCAPGDTGFMFLDIEYGGTVPYLMYERQTQSFASYTGSIRTAFAQDAWRVTRDLMLKLGLRYDTVEYLNDAGTRVADMAKLQPRIGAAWDITGNAKNVLRGSWGRYLHPNSLWLPQFARASSTTISWWYSCSGLLPLEFGIDISSSEECAAAAADLGWDYRTDREGWDPHGWVLPPWEHYATEPKRIDPALRATYADEFILAFEREVGARSSIELSYVDKKTRDLFDDTCNGNLPTPSADAECDYFIVANLSEAQRDFEGFILRYENRGLDWLTLLTSYIYSTSMGSVESDSNTLVDFDRYPWHYENRYGYLSDHRRHRIKLNGFLTLKGDWTIAFHGRWSSGFRWTPQADRGDSPEIPSGTYFVEPRGSREANNNHQLDLQLSKGFTTGRVRFVLIGSVFNVFNSEQPIGVCDSISGCGDIGMGEPDGWQIPRRYEVGFRVEF